MRLIDADKLYDWVRRECNPYGKPTIDFESGNRMLDMIKRSSTAFDKEKVIEELKSWEKASHDAGIQSTYAELDNKASGYYQESRAYHRAIKIVEKGGIE